MPRMRGQGVRFSLWSALVRGMQGESIFRYYYDRFRSAIFLLDLCSLCSILLCGFVDGNTFGNAFARLFIVYIFLWIREFCDRNRFSFEPYDIFDDSSSPRLSGKPNNRPADEKYRICRIRDAMWPGSERSLNVNVRCDQGCEEAIDRAPARPCARGNRETFTLILDVASSTG